MRRPGFIGTNLFLLILSIYTLSLFLNGCSGKNGEDSATLEEIGSDEYIPLHAKDASEATLKDLFVKEATSNKKEISWVVSHINRIEEVVINREIQTEGLETGIQLTYEILNSLPTTSAHKCYLNSSKKSFNPKGLCNKYAKLFSKVSELRYFQADLTPLDDLKTRLYYFDLGKQAGLNALEYNKYLVDALFWTATSLGSWVSTLYQRYKYNIFKLIKNKHILTKTHSVVETMLHKALRINPVYRAGVIHLALGRLYHKVPEKYLEVESGPVSAEKYLRAANKIRKFRHHLPHFYLFQFYKDNNYIDDAIREAKWLLKNLKKEDFVKAFPVYAQREYDAVMEFLNGGEEPS